MSQEATLAHFRQWLLIYADKITEQNRYLTELDAAIGDADHGLNMQLGMEKVSQRLREPEPLADDISGFLRAVAMTLISSIGGAAGPLYGAFFLRAAQGNHSGATIGAGALAAMFRNGVEGIKQRGKAQIDDKTMVDTLEPAVSAMEAAIAYGANIAEALDVAQRAAEKGMKRTIVLEAKKGRASYLGTRSIGHQDPGATSAYYLIEAAAQSLGQAHDAASEGTTI